MNSKYKPRYDMVLIGDNYVINDKKTLTTMYVLERIPRHTELLIRYFTIMNYWFGSDMPSHEGSIYSCYAEHLDALIDMYFAPDRSTYD